MIKNLKIKTFLNKLLIMAVLAAIMTFLMCNECFYRWELAWRWYAITYSIWLIMWFGNAEVASRIGKIYSWLHDPFKRFATEIVVVALYSGSAMMAFMWFIKTVFNIDMSGGSPEKTIYFTVVIAVLVFAVLLSKEFIISWRDLALQEEKMKNEVLTSNFEMLKSQVNPHFMFNSLNTLTSLIYQNQDLAAKYVGQLSKVYRSVLSTQKDEVITIAEELKTLDSYIFLQSIRFENKFKVKIELSDDVKKKYIPPMVLQMLIENCIKHNEITEENPLIVEVRTEGNVICVKNKIVEKKVLPGDNSSIGLANIIERYKILSDVPVQILNDGKEFNVKLPILILE